jgi:hypothetical protein
MVTPAQLHPNMSGLSEFARISARMWGHDIQDDGMVNGSVIFKSYYNPQGSGNSAFVETPEAKAVLDWHYQADFFDDGVWNGSSITNIFGQIYKATTGHDISRQLAAAPKTPLRLTWDEVFRPAPDPMTSAGIQQVVSDMSTGRGTQFSVTELLNTVLWGHDIIDPRGAQAIGQDGKPFFRNLDGSILGPSLNNPQAIDFGFVNAMPQTKQYVQGLLAQPNPGDALNMDFLKILEKIYRIPGAILGR